MTIIAYSYGIIAYDSYITRGDIVTQFDYNKHIKRDDFDIFICGSLADYKAFVDLIVGGDVDKNLPYNTEALYVKDHELFHCAVNEENEYWVVPINLKTTVAIGSGREFAFAAMDCSRSAEHAVAVAIKRNIYCGGKINTFKV